LPIRSVHEQLKKKLKGMEDTLKQVGELLLSSIPTIICVVVVWTAYRFLVSKPLEKVLTERHAKTEGAVQQAAAEIAKAEERVAEYERKVREARAQVYATQEKYRNQVMDERNNALTQARKQADDQVKTARAGLEQEVAATKATLQAQSDALADEIIRTVLKTGSGAAAAGGR
jgi:F-type H+-transporting ATPase subunit b